MRLSVIFIFPSFLQQHTTEKVIGPPLCSSISTPGRNIYEGKEERLAFLLELWYPQLRSMTIILFIELIL